MLSFTCTQQATQPPKKQVSKLPVQDWIQGEIGKYDSAYNLYDSLRRTGPAPVLLLRQSHIFLDSILQYEKEIVAAKDTTLQKLFLKALYYKGTDLCETDDFTEAENLLNKYLVILQDMHLPASAQSAYVHKTIADIYTRMGDNLKAIFHKQQSFQFYLATNDYVNLASETINISIALREKQLYDSAISYLKKGIALPLVKTNRLLTMYTELAKNYLSKSDTISALGTLQKGHLYYLLLKGSKADLAKYEEKNLDRLSDYNSTMAGLLTQQKKFSTALLLLNESLAFYHIQYGDTKKREIGKTYNELGKTFQMLHQQDSAIYCYNRALWNVATIDTNDIFAVPEKDKVYAENTIIESLEQKAAWMFTSAGKADTKEYLACAVNCYDIIMDAEYKLLQYYSYDDSRLSLLRESRRRSENAIAACVKLYSADKNKKWIEKAFRFAEQNKSYILLESVKRNFAANQLLQTDSTYLKLQQAQLNYANSEKEWIEAKNNTDTALLYKADSSLKNADKLLLALQSRLRYSNHEYNTLLQRQDSMPVSAITGFLKGSHTAFLEYFIGDSTSYCFYIEAGGGVALYKLSDSLQQAVSAMLDFFKTKNKIIDNPVAYNHVAYELCTILLLNKIDKQVNKLIIIADDKLSFIPFDALVTRPVNSFQLSSFNYLIKQFEINYGYSAATLLKQLNYSFKNDEIAVFTPVFAGQVRDLNTLPFSIKEAENIKRIFPDGKYFENDKATLHQFKTIAPAAGIIHVASHASAAGIPRIEFYDGTLYLQELYTMRLHANLVVLSGCETGIGNIEKSEGAISLARGFYFAGTHSVITSLWKVDDNSTADLFSDFYGNAKNGHYGKALHISKRNYLNSGINNDKYSPYYWAAFVYIGLDSTNTENSLYGYMIILIAAIALFVIIKHLTKSRAIKGF